ncbi:Transmembrane protein 198 [Chionoecetes opilio]|uniref:Transmembrane protein 198 n=1 Tax=Chionoecetes opilio TaxID=41210 RepID=A0A8J4XPL3_CHIOP|nr:Transmembrane protein 198 [Chionoecetes opilio]
MSWLGGDDPGGGGFRYDYPWWAAEDRMPRNNLTWNERCRTLDYQYHVVTAVISGMFLIFGVVYSLFGYRCFKAVMFLTGFIFASVVVYLICLSEDLLPLLGNAGVALGAGVMFGLITMLVQYVGLFMTGLHTGLFLGVAGIAIAYRCESVAVTDLEYDAQSDTERNDAGRVYYEENEPQIVMGSYMFEPEYEVDKQVLAEPEVQQEDLALLQNMDWWVPSSVWPVVGILLASGLLLAILTLYFQKGLTIIGTSVSGGAIMSATLDYFIEKFLMVYWFGDRLKVVESERPCWFSWMILGVWPFMVMVGSLTQWRLTGRGIYHQQLVPSKKNRSVNLQRLRSREARAEMRQKKYRYLYQVRTAHGDIISQLADVTFKHEVLVLSIELPVALVVLVLPWLSSEEYVQSLQRKAYPTGDNGTLQSDSTHTTMLPPDHTQLAPLTESEDDAGSSQPPPSPPEAPRHTRVTMH